MLSADDIAEIFEWIEMLLIGSLKRNLTRHENEEKKYGFNWSAWQAEKLRNVNRFRRENAAIVGKYTDTIDRNTRALLEEQFREGVNGAAEEAGEAPEPQPVYMQDIQPTQPELPEQPEQAVQPEQPQEQPTPETTEQVSTEPPAAADEPIAVIKPEPQFFGVDTVKVNKLVEDMTTMEKQAETAALRMTDDVYRQTLNRVQLAMSTGSMTLQKAIDTAVEDFLNAGINCIEYKDGRRVNIADYVRMALRTTSTRAALQGHSEKLKALGYDTVAVSSYGMCSPTCLPYQGRVYINDAFTSWSGEIQVRADGLTYGKSNYCGKWFPLLSSAIAGGLFHPNCRHGISMWRDGDPLPETLDNSETERRYKLEQQQRELERAIRKAKRKAEGFTDPENVAMAKAQQRAKEKELQEHIDKVNEEYGKPNAPVLVRDSGREKIYDDTVNKNVVDNGGESGIINIEIDELTPCLRDNKTGELVETEVRQIIDYNELKECTPQNGWDFPWDKPPKDSEVYAVSVKDSTEIEGLIALRSEPNNDAVYMYWGNAAPHNRITDNNTEKKYNGVGGHLFAVAIHKSLQNGFGGVIYADAANKELLSHFINEHGAFPIGTHEHPYRFLLDGESAKNLFKTYNFDWR